MSQGFSLVITKNFARPECVVCGELQSHGSMKPSLRTCHLKIKHSDLKNKNVTFFKSLRENKNKDNMHNYFFSDNANRNAVEASFRISYLIAKGGKITPSVKN